MRKFADGQVTVAIFLFAESILTARRAGLTAKLRKIALNSQIIRLSSYPKRFGCCVMAPVGVDRSGAGRNNPAAKFLDFPRIPT
jgi:hypothetical protein